MMTMPDEPTQNETPAPLERRLATILCADVAGYSQMMGVDEERTVRVFRGHREIFESLVLLHRGRIFNTAGDALLAEFNSAVEAVRCATEIQAALATRNRLLPPAEKMLFRMGINLGDVIVQGGDLLGDGVNVAARIQAATEPGGICISGSVYDQIQNKLSLDFKLLGEQSYKNIAKPVRTYTINEGVAVTAPARRHSWKIPAVIAAVVLALGAGGYWMVQEYDARQAEQERTASQMAAQLAAQKQASDEAQRAAENARREAQAQADKAQKEKAAADEALRRAQDERNRLEQERKSLAKEKRGDDGTKSPTPVPQVASTARAAAAAAVTSAAQHDGTYRGKVCNRFRQNPRPVCWPTALVVHNRNAEGNWVNDLKMTVSARGVIAADGSLELKLNASFRTGNTAEAVLTGRVGDGEIDATGQWRNGDRVIGNWTRAK